LKKRYGGYECEWDMTNTFESRLTKEQCDLIEKIGDRLGHPLRRPVETIETPNLPGAPIEPDPPKKKRTVHRKKKVKTPKKKVDAFTQLSGQLTDDDLL